MAGKRVFIKIKDWYGIYINSQGLDCKCGIFQEFLDFISKGKMVEPSL
jgi:hypothetical protein